MSRVSAFDSSLKESKDIYSKIVLHALSRFKKGRLTLTLPDGRSLSFGEGGGIECSLIIRSSNFFKRAVLFGDIGFGESYCEGEWETPHLTDLLRWMILNWEDNPGVSGARASNMFLGILRWLNRLEHLFRPNNLKGSVRNISAHYDLSNELFAAFLDASMTYSSADFSTGALSLESAQIAKFDRLARMAKIKASDRVLEIGGGWGAMAIHLAKVYGCEVDSLTVSKKQFEYFKKRIEEERLGTKVRVHFLDYRKVEGEFDKIVSIEMLEAVGHKNMPSFFKTADRVLKADGLMALQVITCADSRYDQLRRSVDWIQKYIFPGSLLPSVGSLVDAARKDTSFQLSHLHSMGDQYPPTLRAWKQKFNESLPEIKKMGFDNRFIQIWNYYLSYCEAAFSMRHIDVVQMLFTRPNNQSLS